MESIEVGDLIEDLYSKRIALVEKVTANYIEYVFVATKSHTGAIDKSRFKVYFRKVG
jgi:hypothetical protein